MTAPKGAKTRYKTTNWATYNAALKAWGSLTIWLGKDMQWYAPASGKRGRQRTFSEAAIQFCLSIKFLGEGEWKRKKHGAEYRRQWRKVHLGIDAHTLEIGAIEVTDNSVEDGAGGAPMLPELRAQMPPDEATASVSADGAHDTKACHAAIAQRGAQAGTPPRKNGKPWKATLVGASVRNEALKACHRLGCAICKQWSGDHRRSLGGRPRYMASSVWMGGSWRARSSVRWWSCMCEWHCSTASRSSGARQRCPWSPWHSCVWGWGHLVPLSTCATKPLDGSSSSTAFCLG